MGWGYACCPADGEPLISTMERPKKEFFCQVCKTYYEFLQPVGKSDDTPGLADRLAELEAEFKADTEARDAAKAHRDEWRASRV